MNAPLSRQGQSLQVGDRVSIDISHLLKHSQREIRKSQEYPLGELLTVQGFELKTFNLSKSESRKTWWAKVERESGELIYAPCDYLQISEKLKGRGIERVSIEGREAFKLFCSLQSPKSEGAEIWFKVSHNWFYHGEFTQDGEFTITRSVGNKQKGRRDAKRKRFVIRNPELAVDEPAFDTLDFLSRKHEGGVFYLPDQPIGAPEKESVSTSNDMRCEFDEGTSEEQWQRLEQFTGLTGIAPTFTLSSGGKSIHAHWKLDNFYPVDRVVYLNRLIAVLMLSDEAVSHVPQPMRCPGFDRKGKNHQAIIQVSGDRYSFDQLKGALRTYADSIGIRFPDDIPENWWKGTPALIKKAGFHHKPGSALIAKFNQGLQAWEEQQRQQQQQHEKRRAEVKVKHEKLGLTGTSLVDLVNQTCDRLGSDAFDNPIHGWQWSGNRARGCCSWHQSTSKSSAWITSSNNGAWLYHCNVCTDTKGVNAFSYWLREHHGIDKTPHGKQWVDLAKQFLDLHGVRYDEPRLSPKKKKGKSGDGAEKQEPSRKERAEANWIPLLSSTGDSRQFFGDALADKVADTLRSGDRTLIVQSGPPGVGKTTSGAKAARVVQQRGESLISITPLESSARALAGPDKFNIPYRKDNQRGDESFSCCTNSLIPDATNANWEKRTRKQGGIALWDEGSETLEIISGFGRDARIKREVAQGLASSRQLNITQSATLKQYDVEFFQNLGGYKESQVSVDAIAISPHPRNIKIYHHSRHISKKASGDEVETSADPKLDLINLVLSQAPGAKENQVAFVVTSNSQQLNSSWGTMLLESVFRELGNPVTRIDSQSSKDPSHPAHALAKQGDIMIGAGEILLVSPSVETNTSIHCSSDVSLCIIVNLDTGNMTVERLLQSNRVRGRQGLDIEQHIAISDYIGKLKHGNAFTPGEVLADIKLQQSNRGAKALHQLMDGVEFDEQHWTVRDYCTREADKACSLIAKERILPGILKDQGHDVTIASVPMTNAAKAQRRETSALLDNHRAEACKKWNEAIASAETITQAEKEELERRGSYSIEEWYSIKRFKVERVLGNRLESKVENGSVTPCSEGIELTPDYVDAVDKRRLATFWHRSFSAFQTSYDWLIKSHSKLSGAAPSLLDSTSSIFAHMTSLKDCGILDFFKKYAITESTPEWNYASFLWNSNPSETFQNAMVKQYKAQAFTSNHPQLQEITKNLNAPGELEKLTALLGIRDVERNDEGKCTIGNVLTIIRRYFGVRSLRSQSVRVDGEKGATILTLDDRTHQIYGITLKADKARTQDDTAALEVDLERLEEGVHRSSLFSIWEEQRKASGAIFLENVPLLQRMALLLGNKGTSPEIPLEEWLSGLGVNNDRQGIALDVGDRVERNDCDGWGGIVKAIRETVADVLFDLESVTRVIPVGNLALQRKTA